MAASFSLTSPDARQERTCEHTVAQEPTPKKGDSLRYLFAIPVVNRPDLLARALQSVPALWPHAVIVDNTADGLEATDWPVRVDRPSVPLSVAQTVNYLRKITLRDGLSALLYMHNDAEAQADTGERFVEFVDSLCAADRRWGIVFTQYDTLVAFSAAMLREVGEWDVVLPQYFADNDYYRRAKFAGFEIVESGLPVEHNRGGSNTIRSDPRLDYLNGVTFQLYERYYAAKWGGRPGQETFPRPFNGVIECS